MLSVRQQRCRVVPKGQPFGAWGRGIEVILVNSPQRMAVCSDMHLLTDHINATKLGADERKRTPTVATSDTHHTGAIAGVHKPLRNNAVLHLRTVRIET